MTQKQEGCKVLFQPHLGQSWFPDESLSSAFCSFARMLWLDKPAHFNSLCSSFQHASNAHWLGRRPFSLHLHVKDINGCVSLCGLILRRLPSSFTGHGCFPHGGEGSLSALTVSWASVGEKSRPRSSLRLLGHARTIVFLCQSAWQDLQTEGGWLRAAERIEWLGGGMLVRGNPREEIREQYRSSLRRFAPMQAWPINLQHSAECQNPEAEVRIQDCRQAFISQVNIWGVLPAVRSLAAWNTAKQRHSPD